MHMEKVNKTVKQMNSVFPEGVDVLELKQVLSQSVSCNYLEFQLVQQSSE